MVNKESLTCWLSLPFRVIEMLTDRTHTDRTHTDRTHTDRTHTDSTHTGHHGSLSPGDKRYRKEQMDT